MYNRILALTEEIESVITTDDHARLQNLMAARAEEFANITDEEQPHCLESAVLIKKIQDCEKRCREQASRKTEEIRKDLETIRNGRRLNTAYCRFAGNS